MSSILPKDPHDLSLAPVAVSIDRNLQGLRDIEPTGIMVAQNHHCVHSFPDTTITIPITPAAQKAGKDKSGLPR